MFAEVDRSDGELPPRRPHSRHGVGHRAGWPARAREGRRRAGHRHEASRHRGHPVPHRVDDEGVHGAVDPEAQRRGQARARRARRNLRAGVARLEVPDGRLAEDSCARSAHAHRGLRHRRSLGRSADAAPRRASSRVFCATACHSRDRRRWRWSTRTSATPCSAASSPTCPDSPTRTSSRDCCSRLWAWLPPGTTWLPLLRNVAPLATAGRTTPGSSSRRWRTAPSARWAASRRAPPTTPSGFRICSLRGRLATAPTPDRCDVRACASWRRGRTFPRFGCDRDRAEPRRAVRRRRTRWAFTRRPTASSPSP